MLPLGLIQKYTSNNLISCDFRNSIVQLLFIIVVPFHGCDELFSDLGFSIFSII